MAFPRTAVSDMFYRSCVKTSPVRPLFLQILEPSNYKCFYLIIRLKKYIGFPACRCRVLVIFKNIQQNIQQKCIIRIQKACDPSISVLTRFRSPPCKRIFYGLNAHVPAVDQNRIGRSLFLTGFDCSVYCRENALKIIIK